VSEKIAKKRHILAHVWESRFYVIFLEIRNQENRNGNPHVLAPAALLKSA
jgi:hypothetical protein